MIRQLAALAALKFRLFRRSMNTAQAAGCLTALVLLLLLTAGGIGAGYVLHMLTRTVLASAQPLYLLAVLDGLTIVLIILWVWQSIVDLQRPDLFDMRKLLHLPVPRFLLFAVNAGAAMLTPLLIIYACGATGVLLALHEDGAVTLPVVLLILVFHLLLSAIGLWIRGFVTTWLLQRRRKVYIALLMFPALIAFNLSIPFLADTERWQHFVQSALLNEQSEVHRLWLGMHQWLPPLWLPHGIFEARHGEMRAAWGSLGALGLFALLFFALAYRAALRQALQQGGPAKRRTRPGLITWTALRLPLVPNDTTGLALACVAGYARNPHVQMLLGIPLLLGAMLLGMRSFTAELLGNSRPLVASLLIAPLMGYGGLFFNQFGVDGPAFRNYILLPTPRHRILLAKNIALLPVTLGLGGTFLLLIGFLRELDHTTIVTACIVLLGLHFGYALVGNYFSIFLPHRLQRRPGASGATRLVQMLVSFTSIAFSMVLLLPAMGALMLNEGPPPWWPAGAPPAGVALATAIFLLLMLLWYLSLRHAGDLLALREQQIANKLYRDRE